MVTFSTVVVVPRVVIPDTLILFVLILSVAAIPVNADPSPEKLVAVTTPTAFKPPARILAPTLAVRTQTESTFVTSS